MILGHIGVRKGSVGLPNKNKKILNGQPLFQISLDQLLNSDLIDSVVVSTDDPQIYDTAMRYGCLDIGLRKAHLASSEASKLDVWKDSLALASQYGVYNTFVDLDCTSPLRLQSDINNAIGVFESECPDMVMSCCIARKNPYFNLVEVNPSGYLMLSKRLEGRNIVARQQAPLVYEHAASTYVLSCEYLRSCTNLYEGRVLPYLMPPQRCWDIDTELDFEFVEFLMNRGSDAIK